MKTPEANDEHQDPAWELLDRARKVEASPVFVQNVVRKARQMAADGDCDASLWQRWLNLLRQPVFAVGAAAAAVVAIAAFVSLRGPQPEPDSGVIAGATTPTPPSVDVADAGGKGTVAPDTSEQHSLSTSPAMATTNDYSFADQLENIDYLGELVAVTDPAMLDDQMMADLLY